jgi:uncharacterized protein (TIGR02996 family)
MTPARTFLQEIKEHPDDDTPRLIFADWLEEQGDPRGVFLRSQVLRAQLSPRDPRQEALKRSEGAVFREHFYAWLGPLIDHARWEFDRGLIVLEARAEKFLTPEVASLATPGICDWIIGLRLLETRRAHLPRLLESPYLPHVALLDLSGNRLGPEAANVLGQSAAIAHLRTLLVGSNRLGPLGATALATSKHLAGLTMLDLSSNAIDRAGAVALAESAHLGNLRLLLVANNNIPPDAQVLLLERFGERVRWERRRSSI